MIHEITPDSYSVSYDLRRPSPDSIIFSFQGKTVLGSLRPDGNFSLPTFQDLSPDGEDCWFLFSISGKDYFWYRKEWELSGSAYTYASLRRTLSCKPRVNAFAAFTAYHLADWYGTNLHCSICGRPMQRSTKERALVCSECGSIVYPRINPVIIVAVTDGERLLITKYAPSHRPTAYYALVAGFCEIGESLEDTVRREVMEEVGLKVKNIRYFGSQPWGIDGNLSVGFFAELDGSDQIRMDEEELSQALWVNREEVPIRDNTIALTSDMMESFRLGKW